MSSSSSILFVVWPVMIFIIYGLLFVFGIYILYLIITLLIKGNKALGIYLDEKRNSRL